VARPPKYRAKPTPFGKSGAPRGVIAAAFVRFVALEFILRKRRTIMVNASLQALFCSARFDTLLQPSVNRRSDRKNNWG
jgi:hypothetical protein